MTTIETKIAKNGSTRYYVREENGKLTAISRAKALELQAEIEQAEAEEEEEVEIEETEDVEEEDTEEVEEVEEEENTEDDDNEEVNTDEEYTEEELHAAIASDEETIAKYSTGDIEDAPTVALAKWNIAVERLDLAKKEQRKAERAWSKLPCGADDATQDAAIARCDAAEEAVAIAEAEANAAKQELDKAYAEAAKIADARRNAEYEERRAAREAAKREEAMLEATVTPEAQDVATEAEIEAASLAQKNVAVANGNYSETINGEEVTFTNFSISKIIAPRLGFGYSTETGKGKFYSLCGGVIIYRPVAKKRIYERYAELELAADQLAAVKNFFDAYDAGNDKDFFRVQINLDLADGQKLYVKKYFNYFNQTIDFANAVIKKFSGEVKFFIATDRNDINEHHRYVKRDREGYITYDFPATSYYAKMPASEIQNQIDGINKAISENEKFAKQNKPVWSELMTANHRLLGTRAFLEFALHDNEHAHQEPTEPEQPLAGKSLARALTEELNAAYGERLRIGFPRITPFGRDHAHYVKLHPAARWTVAYDTLNDTYGIWSEYGWHESGFSLGHDFCGWYSAEKLIIITNRLKDTIEFAGTEFYFESPRGLFLKKKFRKPLPPRTYPCKRVHPPLWEVRQRRAAALYDKIGRDSKPLDSDSVFDLLPKLDELNDTLSEYDIWDAQFDDETTDRNDRFNRGDIIAKAATDKICKVDPSAVITFDIDEGGNDRFWISFDGIVRTPFATANDAESFFYTFRQKRVAETASVPEDNFNAKLAALKAECDKAEQVTADKKAALAKAEEEYHDAAKRSAAALQDLQILCANVERQLDQDLLADFPLSSEMEITALDGQSYKTKFTEPYFVFGDIGEDISLMVFKDASNITWKFAAYDTPDQMKVAIAMLKDAIARGEKKFTFPTADAPPKLTADIAEQCETINDAAPCGWSIGFDTDNNRYSVKFKGCEITTLDTLSLAGFLSIDEFFAQFKPLIIKDCDPARQFIDDRKQEIAALKEMLATTHDKRSRKKLKALIKQNQRDIQRAKRAG